MRERLRAIYNGIFYTCIRMLFAFSPRTHFAAANGWTYTYRRGSYVYKTFNIPFLFHPANSFAGFLAFHRRLLAEGLPACVPPFVVGCRFVRYAFIEGAQDLFEAMRGADSQKRLALLRRALDAVAALHEAGVAHGDLKPKNLLVDREGRVWCIDFENARFAGDAAADYAKLIPRLVYFFSGADARALAEDQTLEAAAREVFVRYGASFSARALLEGVAGLCFEADRESPGDDIDVRVRDESAVVAITARLDAAGVDHRLFYVMPNNIKLYVYSALQLAAVDLHLTRPLRKTTFLARKLVQYPATQIAVTGPDGVGKTTLLEQYLAERRGLPLPARLVHAARFVRDRRLTLLDRVGNRLSLGLYTRRLAYARLLQTNEHAVVLLDRSFYDPFLQASGFWFALSRFFKAFFPRRVRIMLMRASSEVIRARKPQLTRTEIVRYYARAAERLPVFASLDAEQPDMLERFSSLVQYLALTEPRFLS